MPVKRLFIEMRRRRVFRTAALYIVGTWLVLQVADVVFPALDIPERAVRYVLLGAVLGLVGGDERAAGLGGEVLERVGGLPVAMPGSEVFTSMQTGVIDATEWVGPYDDEKLGFHRVAKNYYYPGWWEPGPSLSFLVNLDAWNELPAVYKEIFQTASAEAATVAEAAMKRPERPAIWLQKEIRADEERRRDQESKKGQPTTFDSTARNQTGGDNQGKIASVPW